MNENAAALFTIPYRDHQSHSYSLSWDETVTSRLINIAMVLLLIVAGKDFDTHTNVVRGIA